MEQRATIQLLTPTLDSSRELSKEPSQLGGDMTSTGAAFMAAENVSSRGRGSGESLMAKASGRNPSASADSGDRPLWLLTPEPFA